MLNWTLTDECYCFRDNNKEIAIGMYENGQFLLLHENKTILHRNAMQAFVQLRTIYDPIIPTPKTMLVFDTPSRTIGNMSKFNDNPILKHMPLEVFYANLPS